MSSGQEPKQQDNSAARFDRWNDPEGWSLVRGPVSDEGWTSAGRFDFSGHGDFWNSLPNEPGVYRLKFSENLYYVGQAKSISRRLGDYYQPGQGIESDHRIHRALRKFNGADVQVMTGDQFNNPTIRRQKENAEIDALRQIAGVRVLNGDCIENLQDRIEYHQDEIEKLKKKISDLTKNSEVIENV